MNPNQFYQPMPPWPQSTHPGFQPFYDGRHAHNLTTNPHLNMLFGQTQRLEDLIIMESNMGLNPMVLPPQQQGLPNTQRNQLPEANLAEQEGSRLNVGRGAGYAAAGAVAGAAIVGGFSLGIGAPVGAAIGGAVGGLIGLFSKKN